MATTASTFINRIRTDYPQAGRDNDSQGFRDNFRNIFNAFSATNADIESLQLNSVTLGGNNDFGYNTIKKVTLQSSVIKVIDYTPTPTNGAISVNYNESNYQKYSLNSGTSTLTIQNWPATGLAEMKLSLKPNSTFTTTIYFGGNITTVGNIALPLSTTSTATIFVDLWTDNGGNNLFVSRKGF